MCCVMPPDSPRSTCDERMRSSSEVLPWSTWPMIVTTGARGLQVGADGSAARAPSASCTSSSKLTCMISTPSSVASSVAVLTSSTWLMLAIMPRFIRRWIRSFARTPSFSANSRTVMPSETMTGPVGMRGGGLAVVLALLAAAAARGGGAFVLFDDLLARRRRRRGRAGAEAGSRTRSWRPGGSFRAGRHRRDRRPVRSGRVRLVDREVEARCRPRAATSARSAAPAAPSSGGRALADGDGADARLDLLDDGAAGAAGAVDWPAVRRGGAVGAPPPGALAVDSASRRMTSRGWCVSFLPVRIAAMISVSMVSSSPSRRTPIERSLNTRSCCAIPIFFANSLTRTFDMQPCLRSRSERGVYHALRSELLAPRTTRTARTEIDIE